MNRRLVVGWCLIALAQDFKFRFTRMSNISNEFRLTGQMAADFLLQNSFWSCVLYGRKDVLIFIEFLQNLWPFVKNRLFLTPIYFNSENSSTNSLYIRFSVELRCNKACFSKWRFYELKQTIVLIKIHFKANSQRYVC